MLGGVTPVVIFFLSLLLMVFTKGVGAGRIPSMGGRGGDAGIFVLICGRFLLLLAMLFFQNIRRALKRTVGRERIVSFTERTNPLLKNSQNILSISKRKY